MAASGEEDRLLESSTPSRPKSCYTPARYVLTLLMFWGYVSLSIFRSEMNVTILSITSSSKTSDHHNQTKVAIRKPQFNSTENTTDHSIGSENTTYHWTSFEVSMILGGFFWGYCVMQIPGSCVCTKTGGKLALGLCGLANSLFSVLIPFAAQLGPEAVVICRVLSGVTQSVSRPSEFQIITRWAPSHQIHLLRAIILAGVSFGVMLTYSLDSFVCEHFSWTYVFYIHSAIGFTWSVFWLTMIHDSPEDHPRMSQEELDLIVETRVTSPAWQNERLNWFKLLSSASFWAPAFVGFSFIWTRVVFESLIPGYLHDGLGFGLVDTGTATTITICSVFLTGPLAGFLSDRLISRDFLSKKNTRKLMISIGLFVPVVILLTLCTTENQLVTLILISTAMGASEFSLTGHINNFIDLTPKFSGQLFGVANTFGAMSGFIAPLVLSGIGSNEEFSLLTQWRVFFIISSCVLSIGGFLFLVFGQGNIQESWIKEKT